MNGYTPFSIYIPFIDSITFIRRQGEGFKLRLLRSVSEYLVKDWWWAMIYTRSASRRGKSLMWAKLCLYYRFALKIPNSEPIPEYSVEFFFFLFLSKVSAGANRNCVVTSSWGIQSCVWHITPVMSRQSA